MTQELLNAKNQPERQIIQPFIHLDAPAEKTLSEAPKPAPRKAINPFVHMDGSAETASSETPKSAPRKVINPFVHMDEEPHKEPVTVDVPTESVLPVVITPPVVEPQAQSKPFDPISALRALIDKANGVTSETKPTKPASPKVTPFLIMRRFVEQHAVLVIRGELYVYETNYYRRLLKDDAKTMISSFCQRIVGDEVTTRLVSEVLGQLRAYAPVIDNDAIVDDSLVASPSGLFDIRTGSFIVPHPVQRCFHFLPHRIALELVGEQLCPHFSAFLNSVTGGTPALIQRLWELTAVLLTPIRIKCLPTLFGPPSSGKSVYIALMKKLHAHGDCFPLTFDRLTDRFSLSYAASANLITYFDIPNKRLNAKEVAMLKSLCSTEDDLAVESKGKAVTTLSSSRLKVILATNFPIRGYTRDEALEERLTYFVFPNSIPKEARVEHLSDLLAGEGDAIVSTAIFKYLPQILASNFRFSGEPETEAIFDSLTTYIPEDDEAVIFDFIDNRIEDAPGNKISTAELFAEFARFCDNYAVFNTDKKFSECFAKAIGGRATKCRLLVNGKSVNGYRGIRLRSAISQNNSCII